MIQQILTITFRGNSRKTECYNCLTQDIINSGFFSHMFNECKYVNIRFIQVLRLILFENKRNILLHCYFRLNKSKSTLAKVESIYQNSSKKLFFPLQYITTSLTHSIFQCAWKCLTFFIFWQMTCWESKFVCWLYSSFINESVTIYQEEKVDAAILFVLINDLLLWLRNFTTNRHSTMSKQIICRFF